MTTRAEYVVERYSRRAQLPADAQSLALLGFICERNPSLDPAAAVDHYEAFRQQAGLRGEQVLGALCYLVDRLDDDAGFLKYFEEFTLQFEEALRIPSANRDAAGAAPAARPVTATPATIDAATAARLADPLKYAAQFPRQEAATAAAPAPAPSGDVVGNQPAAAEGLPPPIPPIRAPARTVPGAGVPVEIVDVPVTLSREDYYLVAAYLIGKGPRSGEINEVLARFRVEFKPYTVTVELTVGQAGPGIDVFLAQGKKTWTARPVYEIDRPSEVVPDDGKAYRVRLVCPT